MGFLDKVFDTDDDKEKKKADFSDVRSGSSSTAPSPAPGAQQVAAGQGNRTYTVQAGDSLSRIAKREYGDASQWKKIHEANKDQIKDPDLIHPGQTLRLP